MSRVFVSLRQLGLIAAMFLSRLRTQHRIHVPQLVCKSLHCLSVLSLFGISNPSPQPPSLPLSPHISLYSSDGNFFAIFLSNALSVALSAKLSLYKSARHFTSRINARTRQDHLSLAEFMPEQDKISSDTAMFPLRLQLVRELLQDGTACVQQSTSSKCT